MTKAEMRQRGQQSGHPEAFQVRLWDLDNPSLIGRLEDWLAQGHEPSHPHERLLLRTYQRERPVSAKALSWNYLAAVQCGQPDFVALLAELRQIREFTPIHHRGQPVEELRRQAGQNSDAALALVRAAVECPKTEDFHKLCRWLVGAKVDAELLHIFFGLYQGNPELTWRLERLDQLLSAPLTPSETSQPSPASQTSPAYPPSHGLPARLLPDFPSAPTPKASGAIPPRPGLLLGPARLNGQGNLLLIPQREERRCRNLVVGAESIQERPGLYYSTGRIAQGDYSGGAPSRFLKAVKPSLDGKLLGLYCHDLNLDLIDGQNGQFLHRVEGLTYNCFCRHGEHLYLGSPFGLFRLGNGGNLEKQSEEPVCELASCPTGRLLVLQSQGYLLLDGTHICLWVDPAPGLRLSPTGQALAVGSQGRIRLLELPSGRPLSSFPLAEGSQLAFTLDGEALAVLLDGVITLWSLGGKVLDRFFADGRSAPQYETRSHRDLARHDRFFDDLRPDS